MLTIVALAVGLAERRPPSASRSDSRHAPARHDEDLGNVTSTLVRLANPTRCSSVDKLTGVELRDATSDLGKSTSDPVTPTAIPGVGASLT